MLAGLQNSSAGRDGQARGRDRCEQVRAGVKRGRGSGDPSTTRSTALSVDEIVEVGLRLGRRVGFETLSMRVLARELNVSPMATYRYVSNKQALLALLIDAVLCDVEIPPDDGSWKERLRTLHTRNVDAFRDYPGLDQVTFDLPPTSQGWRLMDGYVQILLDAGFPEREAALAFSVIHSYGLGRATMERKLAHGGERLNKLRDHPPLEALRQLDGHRERLQGPSRDFGMDLIIAGLGNMLEATGRSPKY